MRAVPVVLVLSGCNAVLGLDPTHLVDAPAPDITTGLVAHYTMDAIGPGACMPDATANHHDGTCVTGTPTLVPGKIGSAFQLDGTDEIDVAAAPDLDPASALTVAVWVKLDAPPAEVSCVVNRPYGSAADNSWQICVLQSNFFFIIGSADLTTSQPVPTGDWHHLAVTWDGHLAAGWLDGVQVIAQTGTSGPMFDGNPMTVGVDLDCGAADPVTAFTGEADDLRIYDRALNAGDFAVLVAP